MPGSIVPLPVMLEEEDQKIYDQLEAPTSIVCRYGYMRMIAELPYDGEAKPGCGSKLVIRTNRGIELAEMLTTTCPNSGCGKAVSRKDMLEYIENSGGKNYPFSTHGKVLRVATIDDLNEKSQIEQKRPEILKFARNLIREIDLPMKLVEVELLLGGERIIFHYTSEDWVDFRELVRRLASEYQTRIEMHQVNDRDEARIVADYEKCGQHCCCRQFLKVLKPVSMRSAKVQKATLDPTKISGRCGRLMCCLRYEDKTYEELRKRLPHRQTRVLTEDGLGTVIDSQILTQLVLVRLDLSPKPNAYPLENIQKVTKEEEAKLIEEGKVQTAAGSSRREDGGDRRVRGDRGGDRREQDRKGDQRQGEGRPDGRPPRRPQPGQPLTEGEIESREGGPANVDLDKPVADQQPGDGQTQPNSGEQKDGDRPRKRRRRRGRGKGGQGGGQGGGHQQSEQGDGPSEVGGEMRQGGGEGGDGQPSGEGQGKRKRRRRRRRRGGGGQGGQGGQGGDSGDGGGNPTGGGGE